MKTVSIRDARSKLSELALEVENGATIVVTRHGRPIFNIVPHRGTGGIDFEAGRTYLRSKGIDNAFPYIADDFDAALPEDFLITPERDP